IQLPLLIVRTEIIIVAISVAQQIIVRAIIVLVNNCIHIIRLLAVPLYCFHDSLASISKCDRLRALVLSTQKLPSLLISVIVCLCSDCRYNDQLTTWIMLLHVAVDCRFEHFKICEKLCSPVRSEEHTSELQSRENL